MGERDRAARTGTPVFYSAHGDLAGGYEGGALSRPDLINLHRLTIEEAAAGQRPDGPRS
jgi:hypothetical protein